MHLDQRHLHIRRANRSSAAGNDCSCSHRQHLFLICRSHSCGQRAVARRRSVLVVMSANAWQLAHLLLVD